MFDGIAGHWTPVELAERVTHVPSSLRVASETVTLERRSRSKIEARVERRDVLSPPACLRIPAREAGGLVWVFTDARADSDAPDAPESLGVADARLDSHVDVWTTHWSVAVERMLVEPHLPFRRDDVVGRALRHWLRPDRIDQLAAHPTRGGMRAEWTTLSPLGRAWIEWRRPNGVSMGFAGPRGADLVVHAWCVPVDETSTRLVLLSERSATATLVTPTTPPSVTPRAPSDALVERFHRWHQRYGKRSSAPVPYAALGLHPVV